MGSLFAHANLWGSSVGFGAEYLAQDCESHCTERRRHQVGPVLSDPVPDGAVTLVSGGQRQVLWKEVKGLELWSHWDPQGCSQCHPGYQTLREREDAAGRSVWGTSYLRDCYVWRCCHHGAQTSSTRSLPGSTCMLRRRQVLLVTGVDLQSFPGNSLRTKDGKVTVPPELRLFPWSLQD